jgi:adenylate cyclase class 2
MFAVLGFRSTFRAQKYREEYAVSGARVAIDETPFGVFVEVEGTEVEIERVARLLGRTADDYCLDSYVALWRRHCLDRGEFHPVDMTFERVAGG